VIPVDKRIYLLLVVLAVALPILIDPTGKSATIALRYTTSDFWFKIKTPPDKGSESRASSRGS